MNFRLSWRRFFFFCSLLVFFVFPRFKLFSIFERLGGEGFFPFVFDLRYIHLMAQLSAWSAVAGLIPLLLFVIVDSFGGLKKGIFVAALAAVLELVLSLILLKTVDIVSIASLVLVVVMGFVAIKMRSPTVFKMQPVVVGGVLSFTLVGSFVIGSPLFRVFVKKYKGFMPPRAVELFTSPLGLEFLGLATLYCGIGIFLQSLLVAWAAVKLNNWWWIAFRGVGFYLFSIGAMLLARYQVF